MVMVTNWESIYRYRMLDFEMVLFKRGIQLLGRF